jgi:hypothetical protein
MDDPGWDDTPGFDDEPAPHVPASGPAGGGGGGGTPPWAQPKWLGIGGGALALIVIIILVVILATRGGGGPAPVATPVAGVSTVTTPTATPTPTPTPTPKPKKKKKPAGETLATYDRKIDAVCREYNPQIDPAVSDNDLSKVADLMTTELGKMQRLRTPDDDADEVEKYVNAVSGYWESLEADNIPAFKQQIQSADSLAVELGMLACAKSK